MRYTRFLTCSLFPLPTSLFPVPCSLFPKNRRIGTSPNLKPL
ncbi:MULTISPECIES: hypothetical protein [Moorena]|nr:MULTISPECIES: hypothetical protein [Moorena]